MTRIMRILSSSSNRGTVMGMVKRRGEKMRRMMGHEGTCMLLIWYFYDL